MKDPENATLKLEIEDSTSSTVQNKSGASQYSVDLHSGFLDGLDSRWHIVGWARLINSEIAARVNLVQGKEVLDTDIAQRFRGDLIDASIGNGNYGFRLVIPSSLFNGESHRLSVEIEGVPEASRVLGTLDVHLPNRSRLASNRISKKERADDLLFSVLSRSRSMKTKEVNYIIELNQLLTRIAHGYDYATALGLLYVHVLGRYIDEQGLQSRLSLLSIGSLNLSQVIEEVLGSDELKALDNYEFRMQSYGNDALKAWIGPSNDLRH